MLYLPEKAFDLGEGRGLLFFFHTVEHKAVSLEVHPDSEDPPHVCYYDDQSEWAVVEATVVETGAFEVYAHDFRIEWTKENAIGVIGKVDTASGPFA